MQTIANGSLVDIDPDHIVEVLDCGPGKGVSAVRWNWKEYRDHTKGGYIHIVGMVDRPGVLVFAQDLEYRYYWPPGTPRNDRFKLGRTTFADQMFQVASIPATHEKFAVRVAEKIGLVIRKAVPIYRQDETAFLLASTPDYSHPDCEGFEVFPLRGENVRTLEFREGSALANASQAGLASVLKVAEEAYLDISASTVARQHRFN